VEWISSSDLADALGLTSSTVRQDLSHLDLTGVSKRGYSTVRLETVLRRELGTDRLQRIVIVGAGHLGSALSLHGALKENGFETSGIFDARDDKVGERVGRLKVRPMSALPGVVKNRNVDIGIIAVPADSAQRVADQLVLAGVKGLLNLAYVHIRVPRKVALVDARILASLQELSYATRANRRKKRTKSIHR
jgi:redox-sensing transcriptional repressor